MGIMTIISSSSSPSYSSLSFALELRAGRSSVELYHILRSKPLAIGRLTSNSHGRGNADRNHREEGQGEPSPQGTTGGEGGIPYGEGGPSSAAPYIYICRL